MNARRALLALVAGPAGACLAPGCGGTPPPPTVIVLKARAAPDLNPDAAGAPKPLRVRVFELAGANGLAQAGFFALDSDPARALGPELLATHELVLGPGAVEELRREAKPGTRVVGVVGAYSAIDRAAWRAWATVRPNATNEYDADLGAAGVRLSGRPA